MQQKALGALRAIPRRETAGARRQAPRGARAGMWGRRSRRRRRSGACVGPRKLPRDGAAATGVSPYSRFFFLCRPPSDSWRPAEQRTASGGMRPHRKKALASLVLSASAAASQRSQFGPIGAFAAAVSPLRTPHQEAPTEIQLCALDKTDTRRSQPASYELYGPA